VIHLSGNRRVSTGTFEEALRDPALLNEVPVGFTLLLQVDELESVLQIPYHRASAQLKVEPDRDPAAKGLYASLKAWTDTVKPSFWQSSWLNLRASGGLWFLFLITTLVMLGCIATLGPDTSVSARSSRRSQATELLKSGVTATNEYEAIQLILSYEAGIVPNSRTFAIPSWFLWFVIGGVVMCAALNFAPAVILGIGKGEESIRKWSVWMQLVAITFPTWVIGTFLWPKLLSILEKAF